MLLRLFYCQVTSKRFLSTAAVSCLCLSMELLLRRNVVLEELSCSVVTHTQRRRCVFLFSRTQRAFILTFNLAHPRATLEVVASVCGSDLLMLLAAGP